MFIPECGVSSSLSPSRCDQVSSLYRVDKLLFENASAQPAFTFFIATFFVVWRCDSFFVSNRWKTLLPITKQELKPLMPYTLAWLRLWSINFGYTKLGWFLPTLVHICKVLRPRFEVICIKNYFRRIYPLMYNFIVLRVYLDAPQPCLL